MASNENAFQKEICEAVKKRDGVATRMRHDSIGGIPDLFVKDKSFPAFWVECKFRKKSTCGEKIKITEQQKNYLRKLQKAGGECGWLLCHKVNATTWDLYGSNEIRGDLYKGDYIQTRKRGEIWDIPAILQRLKKS